MSMHNIPQWNREELLSSPLFEAIHSVLLGFDAARFPTLDDLNEALSLQSLICVRSGKQLRFVQQGLGKLAFESQYEPRCYLAGEVQTRENNLHDLFNALVWLVFPSSKVAINARHYHSLTDAAFDTFSGETNAANSALQSHRGRVRDTATLLDESGVIVACANSELSCLLREFKWKELFWNCRNEVNAAMGFYLFGHGLYEKGMHPYVGLTGQGLILPVEAEFFTWSIPHRMTYLDERVAAYLSDPSNCRNTRELTPVPLLGIPGWSADNMAPEYYDNQKYFRTGRRSDVNVIMENPG